MTNDEISYQGKDGINRPITIRILKSRCPVPTEVVIMAPYPQSSVTESVRGLRNELPPLNEGQDEGHVVTVPSTVDYITSEKVDSFLTATLGFGK